MTTAPVPSPIQDPRIEAVLDRLHTDQQRGPGGRPGGGRPHGGPGDGRGGGRPHGRPGGGPFGGRGTPDPYAAAGRALAIHREQGELIYLLCRALGVTRVVEFATSMGVSTIYLAAAVRDNGGGTVIGSEIVPEKAATAHRNLAEAGLDEFVDLRIGDARETLRDLGGPVHAALIDGFPVAEGPTLARQVIELVAPQLRPGALVVNDNGELDYLDYVRDPANGFRTLSVPLKGTTELSVRVDAPR